MTPGRYGGRTSIVEVTVLRLGGSVPTTMSKLIVTGAGTADGASMVRGAARPGRRITLAVPVTPAGSAATVAEIGAIGIVKSRVSPALVAASVGGSIRCTVRSNALARFVR